MNYQYPNENGYYGIYGGRFVPETLMGPVLELQSAYNEIREDLDFKNQVDLLLKKYVGRPTPLTYAANLTQHLGGAKIYLKREDLTHTGAHKINNTIGQALLAKKMGKTRLIAETGAGQHGVATATVAALLGMSAVIYMGAEDMRRQELNVFRMRLLGAEVVGVSSGSRTLKDAISEAMRDWVTNIKSSYYLLGSVLGPHPYPMMVRDFQSVIGREARQQFWDEENKNPDLLIACVGGGSNAMGLFYEFLNDESVKMMGVEAGGTGEKTGQHAARFLNGQLGVFQGTKTLFLQDEKGCIASTHSISAGLDYAGVGPEHAALNLERRAQYSHVSDLEALKAFQLLCKTEGIIPALESSHAVAMACQIAPKMSTDQTIIVNLSGRGDKDVSHIKDTLETLK